MEIREPPVVYGKKHFTIAEYLAIENAAVEKSKYYKGEIFAMSILLSDIYEGTTLIKTE